MWLQTRPNEPLVADRWLDVAYIALWLFYAAWGGVIGIFGLPTITDVTPRWYFIAWATSIGVLSLIAGVSGLLVFFRTQMDQISKKMTEKWAVTILCCFIGLYPIIATWRAFDGDPFRIGTAIAAWTYLFFPLYRVHLLKLKISAIRGAEHHDST